MARRSAGDGTIYQRKDGRWEAIVDLGSDTGHRLRRSIYGKTRRDVQLAMAEALRLREQGRLANGPRQTTGQFLERWLHDSVQAGVRPSTFQRYSNIVNRHLLPHLGRIPLRDLRPEHVQRLLNEKLSAGLSPRSVHHVRAVLRTALNEALRWDLVSRNAATLANSPRQRPRELQILDPDQCRQLLEAIGDDRLEALYTVALALGLRQGETLGLRWRDIDLERRQLRVAHSLQRIDGQLQLIEPKTLRSRRSIVMPFSVVEALRRHRVRQDVEREFSGDGWQENDLVFATPTGRPLDASVIRRDFPRQLARAGLPHIRFHDLRHSCASLLLAQGVSPRTVMEVLGHSQISLTLDTYSHVIPQLMDQAADAMDSVLSRSRRSIERDLARDRLEEMLIAMEPSH